tara:strand:+ start:203 stop:361 length:159 start_codon:yes stop_codon:yes gene_type:complete
MFSSLSPNPLSNYDLIKIVKLSFKKLLLKVKYISVKKKNVASQNVSWHTINA